MRGGMLVVTFLLFFVHITTTSLAASVDSSSNSACGNAVQQMSSCLDYVTAKNSNPTSDCCSAVQEMRTNNVICLCKFIEEVKNGGMEVKQLGIQDTKLDALPKACNMKNTSISQCSLLVASPSSTDSASATTASNNSSTGYLKAALRLDKLVIIGLFALLCLSFQVGGGFRI